MHDKKKKKSDTGDVLFFKQADVLKYLVAIQTGMGRLRSGLHGRGRDAVALEAVDALAHGRRDVQAAGRAGDGLGPVDA